MTEIKKIAALQNPNKKLRQLHFGGGTPNFLLNSEFIQIIDTVKSLFEFEDDAEMAIEIDPCELREGQLEFLADLGFNRLSMGVQDFDEKVQQAVKRVQSKELTHDFLKLARKIGFTGINFDLIYGLPHQTLESFVKTIDSVIEMRPDRMAVYNFAFLPEQMPHQRKIDPATLPDEKEKLDILLEAITRFTRSGYEYIGMDHFALKEDELSVAQENRTLYRTFMGYSPKSGVDLFGIGVTSIGEFGPFFIQNEKKIKIYQEKTGEGGLSGTLGIHLSEDDRIRKWTIIRVICHFYLSFSEFKDTFGYDFKDYFAEELPVLKDMENDGLLELQEDCLVVVEHGKFLVRNICMVFDAYLKRKDAPKIKFSKTL